MLFLGHKSWVCLMGCIISAAVGLYCPKAYAIDKQIFEIEPVEQPQGELFFECQNYNSPGFEFSGSLPIVDCQTVSGQPYLAAGDCDKHQVLENQLGIIVALQMSFFKYQNSDFYKLASQLWRIQIKPVFPYADDFQPLGNELGENIFIKEGSVFKLSVDAPSDSIGLSLGKFLTCDISMQLEG